MSFVNFMSYAANPRFQLPALIGHHSNGSSASIVAPIPPAARRLVRPAAGAISTESQALAVVEPSVAFARQVAPALKQVHRATAAVAPPRAVASRYVHHTQRALDHRVFFPNSYASVRR